MKTRVIATLGMLAASPAAAQQQAQLAQQEGYNRALAACMQGRGYSVS